MTALEKLTLAIELLSEIHEELAQSQALLKQTSPSAIADDATMFISAFGQATKTPTSSRPSYEAS